MMSILRIDEELGATIALVIGLGRSAADHGIEVAAGLGGNALDAHTAQDILNGVGTTFTESHVVFFGTAFVAVANDLNGFHILTGLETVGVFFDGGFGIAADGGFIEVEVSEFCLANRRFNAFLILADHAFGAILIGHALGLGYTAVVFADVICRAIFGDRLRIALGTAAAIAAFLSGRAVKAVVGIAITVDALARSAIANIAFIAFCRAVAVVTAFCTFRVQTVFINRIALGICFTITVFIAFWIRRGASICHTNHKTCH